MGGNMQYWAIHLLLGIQMQKSEFYPTGDYFYPVTMKDPTVASSDKDVYTGSN